MRNYIHLAAICLPNESIKHTLISLFFPQQWVGSSCGLHGPYIFYKAFKFTRDGKPRILSLGDFFFVRCKPEEPICIAELQLLWEERTSKQLLSSSKLYFLPEDTPQGRTVNHGEVGVKTGRLNNYGCLLFSHARVCLGAPPPPPSLPHVCEHFVENHLYCIKIWRCSCCPSVLAGVTGVRKYTHRFWHWWIRALNALTYSGICSPVFFFTSACLFIVVSTAECALVQLRSIRLPLRSMGLIVL